MKRLGVLLASCSIVACGSDSSKPGESEGIGSITASDTGGETSSASGETSDSSASDSGASDSSDPSGGGPGTVFDVGAGGDAYCQYRDPGIYCSDNRAIECGDVGDVVSSTNCVPDICVEGQGCIECLTGQYHCDGPRVLACNDAMDPPQWEEVTLCDPGSQEACDVQTGGCVPVPTIGTIEPTGTYYQFARFTNDQVNYFGGGDVDSWAAGPLPGDDNLIAVVRYATGGSVFDLYTVDILDSDGDGILEPNQHPDNPDHPGEVEERVITHLESIPTPVALSATINELYLLPDRIYYGGVQLNEYIVATSTDTVLSSVPTWTHRFSFIGYDEINDTWYAGNESNRRVFQYSADTDTWGIAFDYPDLAGSHADGLEIVVDQRTGTPYVYVADMTSDFIGQYRWDRDLGWVQENLFQYTGTGEALEGMGFGAFYHFWATSGSVLYEVGGGDLQDYVSPPG
jgi:hypothetical protein